jgi:hypothetical protein
MKNENALIGLFHRMFEGNILTFNPGWDENAKNLEKFDDVREIQQQLKSKGVKLTIEADEKTWVHLKLSLPFCCCGRWGRRPRLSAVAGVPTRQRQF